jgi:transcription elongation GreA/GreB family factor
MILEKKLLLDLCGQNLNARKGEYEMELSRLDEAAANETKSSAGDKYETGREMIAQSRIVIDRNLSEAKAGLEILERMRLSPPHTKIGFGSLVELDTGWFLVGMSLGELDYHGMVVQTISLASPLGLTLKGKGVGELIPWRGKEISIHQIVS